MSQKNKSWKIKCKKRRMKRKCRGRAIVGRASVPIYRINIASIKKKKNTKSTPFYTQITRTPDILSLLQKKVWPILNSSSTLYVQPQVGLERVRRGGYAYHGEASTLYVLVKQSYSPVELCDLNEIYLRPKHSLGFVVNLRSSYHEMFKIK